MHLKQFIASAAMLLGCGGCGSSTSSPATGPSNQPTVSLTLSRADAITYQASTLTWAVTNADTCTASGGWSGSKALAGAFTISTNAVGSNIYELTCSNAAGSTKQSVTLNVAKPTLSFAGTWVPHAEADLSPDSPISLANTFNALVRIGSSGRYGVTAIGWSYSGFGSQAATQTIVKVNAALLLPDANGLLNIASDRLKPDAVTNGAGSVVVADFNDDGYDDIVFIAHNESPFLAAASTVYWGSASGTFAKEQLLDKVMAHDAQLALVDGQKRIFTGSFTAGQDHNGNWVNQPDAMVNPIYAFTNGTLKATEPPRMKAASNDLNGVGGMTNAYIRGTPAYSAKLVAGDSRVPTPLGACCESRTSIFDFASGDITSSTPVQIFMPYLGTLDAYKSYLTAGQFPHVSRVYAKDLNQDGHDDILAAQSFWTQSNNNWPSALQILLNDGFGFFNDATAKLNPDMQLATSELGYTPKFVDLDGSGIEAMLWDGSYSYNDFGRHSDYLILNDGTGRLYLALHPEFLTISNDVQAYLKTKGYSPNTNTPARLIGVPQPDGSLNYLAEVGGAVKSATKNIIWQVAYFYVNVPLRYNPRTDFVTNVTISDRRNSQNIRTWAGDDIISDLSAAKATKIDGGLGENKVIYSGPSTGYSVVQNPDGTRTVTTTTSSAYPPVKDTLKNIQVIQFSDKSIRLVS